MSCTTKKNTFFYRAYHGTTARFNIYFNGSESYKEAEELINTSVRDNYTAILPVFPIPLKTEALKASAQLDRSIEKASKAIKKHSMFIKGVEYCKPIDDCYLLMGQSYYQRQDFSDALSVFSYIINTHPKGNVWSNAHTWKARTNLAMGRVGEAEVLLEEGRLPVANSKNEKYKQHWEATFSEFLLMQKDYEQATIYLVELLKHKHMKKDFKTRIHFILGQTYQLLGQRKDAAEHYTVVLKRNPVYEMDFNATINLALCGGSDKKSKNTAREKLQKMLKDGRNEQYKDQIFYALAQLDLRDEKMQAAINNLEASVYWSINNPYQKTVSALELAEIYFDNNQFVESQKYYDTIVTIIPATFPNYTEIKDRSVILKNLVENLLLVKTQDSLQRIAAMDEKERLVYIDQLIADYNLREQERIADEEEKARMMENTKKTSAGRTSSGTGTWVFYNPTQMRLGSQEFRKRWGNRTLEDYWFLSDVELMVSFDDNTASTEDNAEDGNETQSKSASTSSRTSDPQSRKYYLQDLPTTEEQIQTSNELIATGLYNSGIIYSDDLYDYPKAIAQWEEFLKRFPEHKLKAPVCFQLYETYAYLQDAEKSDYYKNIILQQFPNSNYARIIQDPDYYKEYERRQKESETFYVSVYNAYEQEDYVNTIQLANTGLETYPSSPVSAKFDYLKAISLGKLYGNDTLIPLLTAIIKNYPTTEIDTAATQLLEYLKQLQSQQPIATLSDTTTGIQESGPVYTYNEQSFHFIIIIANIKEVKIDQLKGHLNNFDKEFFRLQQFDISSFYIDDVQQMVTVSRFDNKSKAMDYYHLLTTDTKYVGYLRDTPNTKVYAISDANYTAFFRQKDKRALYDAFFKEYYLK
ncbi:MAG: tetratricopeptide repeat protein [Bacteroidales bacterium]|jgi:tetratricopeptide (TPR) repeat protein|nr:tetratricopeptide repeat protein [Bacteroidales bacterium]